MNKPFDKKSFNRNDPKSKSVIIKFINDILFIDDVVENPNKYGIDLIVNGIVGVEVEHREGHWIGGKFPFRDVNIFGRRAKYLNKHDSVYIVISEDWSTIGILMNDKIGEYITPSNCHEHTTYNFQEDEVFKIPKGVFMWVDLKSGKDIE
jgi:hypothetical protein